MLQTSAAIKPVLSLSVGSVTFILVEVQVGLMLSGQMSVQKLWLAGLPESSSEFTVPTNPDALEPRGEVLRDTNNTALDINALPPAVSQAARVASLCNVAT